MPYPHVYSVPSQTQHNNPPWSLGLDLSGANFGTTTIVSLISIYGQCCVACDYGWWTDQIRGINTPWQVCNGWIRKLVKDPPQKEKNWKEKKWKRSYVGKKANNQPEEKEPFCLGRQQLAVLEIQARVLCTLGSWCVFCLAKKIVAVPCNLNFL